MADKELTIEKSQADFKDAYQAKSKLVKREKEDFLFCLGKQWKDEDVKTLSDAGVKAVTDNRIQPNLFLLTGLQRQNRTDFKAFPEGEEDSLKAEIASTLFKKAIKDSDFAYKSSDQFKDGATCGESHLELYLDNTYDLLNAEACWKKVDGDAIFPEPGFREYDFSDARYVYKLSLELSKDDLISLFPKKKDVIEKSSGGKVSIDVGGEEVHTQRRDYPTTGGSAESKKESGFDLVERYYKKYVSKTFIGDMQTGVVKEAESSERADAFVADYKGKIDQEQQTLMQAQQQHEMAQMQFQQSVALGGDATNPPVAPPQVPPQDPERFKLITKHIPEMWYFAHAPGIDEPLADERAWFYPKWKNYPWVPYFARFSTAPLRGDDAHLLVQGIVHGVKNAQEKHNRAETLLLRHLNSAANSGWLTEEDSWVSRDTVEKFGSSPSVNLEYRKGAQKPERIFPMPLSQGHAELAERSAESIKSQLGINADLLAAQDGTSSGRAIALRQKQGLLMVQELFDNFSRSTIIAGKFLLSQMGQIFDTDTSMKVLGDVFLKKNFPPPMLKQIDPASGMPVDVPMQGPDGQPMQYDKEMAELTIAEVLSGDLAQYDVTVGEAVASDTMRMANASELKELATAFPGVIPPELLIEESQLPQSTKTKVLTSIKNAQLAMAQPQPPAAQRR